MKNLLSLMVFTFLLIGCQSKKPSVFELPHLKKTDSLTQFIVDGKPFIMIAGELHNSSSSTPAYIQKTFNELKGMNLNTVIASIAWEQFEPEEGTFDYSLVDALIENARKQNLKLVLIWFASWKNGQFLIELKIEKNKKDAWTSSKRYNDRSQRHRTR